MTRGGESMNLREYIEEQGLKNLWIRKVESINPEKKGGYMYEGVAVRSPSIHRDGLFLVAQDSNTYSFVGLKEGALQISMLVLDRATWASKTFAKNLKSVLEDTAEQMPEVEEQELPGKVDKIPKAVVIVLEEGDTIEKLLAQLPEWFLEGKTTAVKALEETLTQYLKRNKVLQIDKLDIL
jgi:hypothetical protein